MRTRTERKPSRIPRARVADPDSGGWHMLALFDALGRRKALRLVWELRSARALNFRQLAAACEASPSVLNTRLRELREMGLVEHVPTEGYFLTRRGNELLEHLLPLFKWSRKWMTEP